MGSKEALHGQVRAEAEGQGGEDGHGPDGRVLVPKAQGPEYLKADREWEGWSGAQMGRGGGERWAEGSTHSATLQVFVEDDLALSWVQSLDQKDNGQAIYANRTHNVCSKEPRGLQPRRLQ